MNTILTFSRHSGNENEVDIYFNHCPEAAQPNVTFLGTVSDCGGQLNGGLILLHYCLQVTVYNSFTRGEHIFFVTVCLKNGQRWVKFSSLTPQIQVFVAGRIFGIIKENQQLAVLADEIYFVQATPRTILSSPTSTTKRKRTDFWTRRIPPHTPSKSVRLMGTTSIQPRT
jgi:hypothetical protein